MIEIKVCPDCALIIANDDSSGCENESESRAHLINTWLNEPYMLVITGDETHFSRYKCDGCNDYSAGSRIDAVAIPTKADK